MGVGLEPGDHYYPEPYFYVNVYPHPRPGDVSAIPLRGGGTWHTDEWIGAVLPGSRLTGDPPSQEAQAAGFIESAVEAARELLG